MMGRSKSLLLLVVLAHAAVFCLGQQTELRLGLMLPFPRGDAAIPPRLADEWISAAKLAVNLLSQRYSDSFTVAYFVVNSNCDRGNAAKQAKNLFDDEVVAVVGPACSEAVIGANTVLRPAGIPVISFAATADAFSSALYNNFFRTAYSDKFQAKAVAAVVKNFSWRNVYIFYSNDTYGTGLASTISHALEADSELVGSSVNTVLIPVPMPPPTTADAFGALFSTPSGTITSNKTTAVLFAAPPNVVEGLWKAALSRDLLSYPWWYLVTDGGVAFDLVGEGDNLAPLASKLQGELGVSPYRGSPSGTLADAAFQPFRDFWVQQPHTEYPGLLSLEVTPRFEQPRAYVRNLIDAVWAVFEAAKLLVESNHTVRKDTILDCLRRKGPCANPYLQFAGTSGIVAFDPETGERDESVQPAQYGIMNLVGISWQEQGYWQSGDLTSLSGPIYKVTRPGPIPQDETQQGQSEADIYVAPPGFEDVPSDTQGVPSDQSAPTKDSGYEPSGGTTSSSSRGLSAGSIAGIVLGCIAGVALLVGAVFWLRFRRSRHPDHQQFARMI